MCPRNEHGVTGHHYGDIHYGDTNCTLSLVTKAFSLTALTGTGYELPYSSIRSRRQTALTGAAPPLSVTREAVDLMEA